MNQHKKNFQTVTLKKMICFYYYYFNSSWNNLPCLLRFTVEIWQRQSNIERGSNDNLKGWEPSILSLLTYPLYSKNVLPILHIGIMFEKGLSHSSIKVGLAVCLLSDKLTHPCLLTTENAQVNSCQNGESFKCITNSPLQSWHSFFHIYQCNRSFTAPTDRFLLLIAGIHLFNKHK